MAALRLKIALAAAWIISLLLITFSAYSIYVTGLSVANILMFMTGCFQCVALLKWKRLAFGLAGTELFLCALLGWGVFFPQADSKRVISFSPEVAISLFALSTFTLIVLSGLCLGQTKEFDHQEPDKNSKGSGTH